MEITALLGHNGAGKTTTMQMLWRRGSNGRDATVLGHSIVHDPDAVQSRVAICPQQNLLWDQMTVKEHAHFFADLQRKSVSDEEINELVKKVGLEGKADSWGKSLSGGMKRKLSVVMALVGRPRVLILDEPTAGLDPESRRVVWDLLKEEKKNKTIVLCTHHMEEADLLGDRIIIMAHGKLQVSGSSVFLKQKFGIGSTLAVEEKKTAGGDEKGIEYAKQLVRRHIENAEIHNTANQNEVFFDLPISASGKFWLLAALEKDEAQNNSLVVTYGLTMPSLEEVFLKLADLDHENTNSNNENAVGLDKIRRSSLMDYGSNQGNDHTSNGRFLISRGSKAFATNTCFGKKTVFVIVAR